MNQDHLPCPCGKSSDAFSIYEDTGWGKCFSGSCDRPNWSPKRMAEADYDPGTKSQKQKDEIYGLGRNSDSDRPSPVKQSRKITGESLFDRGLTEKTLQKYGVTQDEYQAQFPIYDVEGNLHATKYRTFPKEFKVSGSLKGAGLWGRNVFPPGGKTITVTEGYEDAMASFQMQGSKYPCVSIHGSSSAVGDCKVDFEYLNSFEAIILNFDNDEAGRKAAAKVAETLPFPIGKVKIFFGKKHKDASDYLKEQEGEDYKSEWWKAESYRPDGLVMGKDILSDILSEDNKFMVDYPFKGMNQKTYGLRQSELVIIHAQPKIGKSSYVKHIEHKLLTEPVLIEKEFGVGILHFEENKKTTGIGLLSIENGVPYHLPDVPKPEADIKSAFDKVLNHNRVILYDHFGSNSIDVVLSKVRHMAAMGCRYIFVDHLSIIVSDQSGDERKQLDEIITKLKMMTMELNICIIAVIHENREGEIRGTLAGNQLADITIKLERDKLDPDPWRANITTVTIVDNRFCGRCGIACHLFYDEATARMTELDEEQAATFEAGGAQRGF